MRYCVYGGQYGSEGKGSCAEFLACEFKPELKMIRTGPRLQPAVIKEKPTLIVAGENSPNSGHTCSLGKTRNLPASSFYADAVLLGPDSVIDIGALTEDLRTIAEKTGEAPPVYIHQFAALADESDRRLEQTSTLIERVSSTGSGSGAARYRKQFYRYENATIAHLNSLADHFPGFSVYPVNHSQYLSFIETHSQANWIFECSQGVLLDVNWGRYPHVTSRSTLPRVAIERNALGESKWKYVGVYRTFPIRTGGPSGPTGAPETTFAEIGVPDEIATVTKRVRRVFGFSSEDFMLSYNLTRPDLIAFTHLDYIKADPSDPEQFIVWFDRFIDSSNLRADELLLSNENGKFHRHNFI